MPRDFEVYLEDIREAIDKVRNYTAGLTRESFAQDDMRIDAVIRNLEMIGEAAKMVPESIRTRFPLVEWKKIRVTRHTCPSLFRSGSGYHLGHCSEQTARVRARPK